MNYSYICSFLEVFLKMNELFPTITSSAPLSQQIFNDFYVCLLDKFMQSLKSEPAVWQHSQDEINELNRALSALKSNAPVFNVRTIFCTYINLN